MKDRNYPLKSVSIDPIENEDSAKKKANECVLSFRNKDIEHAFVDIDSDLKNLQGSDDISHIKTALPSIRDKLFQLYNKTVHHLDIAEFACQPGDKTPLNGGC
jgi:hypothetical protein